MPNQYITRTLEPLVRRCSEHFKVIVVTGPRQVGKTTMLRHLAKEDEKNGLERSYVTLDNTPLRDLARRDPELFLQRYRPPVLIDEIQKAPELLPFIKIQADNASENGLFWLTGSQPLHLMKSISESLAGRAVILEMLGLSNDEITGNPSEPFMPSEEYFTRRVQIANPYDVDEAFKRIAAGQFPGIRALPDDMRAAGFESYVDTYIMRDIRDLAQVADELKFRRFMAACAANTARPVVYSELARIADIDEKTAKAWLSLLVSTYVVKLVSPYANNLLKRLTKQPLLHFTDTGLATYLAGWENARTLATGAMGGHVFETFAFTEIYKSFANAGKQATLFFFRNNDKKEIDLLLEHDGAIHPIEIKETASPRQNDLKNFRALDPIEASDIPAELSSFKREIGPGCVLCLASDTYPLSRRAWAFPVWAI